jgi:hypothetical protein
MWWLSFRSGEVVILRASSLTHARVIAAKHGFGNPSRFVEGHYIDPEQVAVIDDEKIDRMLSPNEVKQLRKRLHSHSPERKVDHRGQQRRAVPVDLAALANALLPEHPDGNGSRGEVAPTRRSRSPIIAQPGRVSWK